MVEHLDETSYVLLMSSSTFYPQIMPINLRAKSDDPERSWGSTWRQLSMVLLNYMFLWSFSFKMHLNCWLMRQNYSQNHCYFRRWIYCKCYLHFWLFWVGPFYFRLGKTHLIDSVSDLHRYYYSAFQLFYICMFASYPLNFQHSLQPQRYYSCQVT
jgi:hypothetical protein